MEDLNLYLKDVLTERPHTRVVLHPCRAVCRSVREGEAADRLDYGGDRIPAVRRAVVPLRWKQRTGSRASCSDSSPCRPSGLGRQGKMYSTSIQASHTTSSGLTDRKTPLWDIQAAKAILGKGEIVRPSAIFCKTLLLTAVMWAIHWAHVPILCIKKTSADFGKM